MKRYLSIIILLGVVVFKGNAQTYKGPEVDETRLLLGVSSFNNVDLVTYGSIAAAKLSMGTGGAASLLVASLRDAVTLPVTLSSFAAKKEGNVINIKWETISEIRFSHFEVLKSTDGKIFNSIAYVSATGNSNTKIDYLVKDYDPAPGANYYQLKMVDLDGASKESSVVSLQVDLNKPDIIIVANANEGLVKFNVYTQKSGLFKVDVVDIQGRKVISENVNLEKGNNSFGLNVNVKPQILIGVIDFGNEKVARKFYY